MPRLYEGAEMERWISVAGELIGKLADILVLATEAKQQKPANLSDDGLAMQIMVVAGAGCHLYRTQIKK